jgi:2-dehydro-3-deoxyphosphooctonate aldolase (KDO 8-P synthase)
MTMTIRVGKVEFGSGRLVLVAGPCVLESLDLGMEVAETVRDLCAGLGFGYVFKSSFDKANRTSIASYRGPGIEQGLEWLEKIGKTVGVPVLTDIHEPVQAAMAAKAVDILQIPAFLCRQTDLLVAAARTGKVLNVKKAQFMAPEDMTAVLSKCGEAGNESVILCERGTSFGYHQLVVDMRSLAVMRSLGAPVMFDATHSVQTPGGKGTTSGGDRRFVLPLARAAVAVGVDSLFLEVHPDPDRAKSDGPNMVPLKALGNFLEQIRILDDAVKADIGMTDLEWVVKSGYGQPAQRA